MYGVFQRDAVTCAPIVDLYEPVENAQRTRLAEKQLGKVRLAEPGREALGDLDANLRRQAVLRSGRREVDLTESSLTNQSIQLIGATALRAGCPLHVSHRRLRAIRNSFEIAAPRTGLMNGMTQKIRRPGMLFERKLVVYERIVAIYDPAALLESAFRIEITGTRR